MKQLIGQRDFLYLVSSRLSSVLGSKMIGEIVLLALYCSTFHVTFCSVLEDLLNIQDASPVPTGNLTDDIDGKEFKELDKLATIERQQVWDGPSADKPYAVVSNHKYVYNTVFNSTSRKDASAEVYKLVGQVMAIATTGRIDSDENRNISHILNRLQGAVLVEYYRSQGAFVYDDDFGRWRFCTWIDVSRVVDEHGNLRICFPYELMNLGAFPRKPVINKDVLDRDTVKRLYRMAKDLEKVEPFLEDWLSDKVNRGSVQKSSLRAYFQKHTGASIPYWKACSSTSSDGTVYVNLLAFGSDTYTQTCEQISLTGHFCSSSMELGVIPNTSNVWKNQVAVVTNGMTISYGRTLARNCISFNLRGSNWTKPFCLWEKKINNTQNEVY